jgi:hypothetical protein
MKSTRLHQLSAAIEERLQQFEAIPLKREGDEYGYCGGMSAPTLYVSGRKDSKVFDLPKEGKATIAYRLRSKSVNYRDDGTETYSTDIQVESIEPKGFEAILAKYDFERARDGGGRFSPGQQVSSDEMASAYLKPKKKKKDALLAGAGAAGLTAAALTPKGRAGMAAGVGRLVRAAV